jgi:hypothetical protein
MYIEISRECGLLMPIEEATAALRDAAFARAVIEHVFDGALHLRRATCNAMDEFSKLLWKGDLPGASWFGLRRYSFRCASLALR